MDDIISRKAATETARKCSVKEVTPNYMLIDKAEIMTELMMLPPADAIDARQCRECKYKAINKALEAMEQPEIVRCKDCVHHGYEKDIPYCGIADYGYGWEDNDFCSRAKRRTDE